MAIQFALVAAIVGAGFLPPRWPESVRGGLGVAGALLALAGVVFAVSATRALGRSLTPFPRPSERGLLVERGPYRLVRHPIYGAGLLFFTGYALCASVAALVGTAALAFVWALKSRLEERLLAGRYPGYSAYAARVRRRFLPYVW